MPLLNKQIACFLISIFCGMCTPCFAQVVINEIMANPNNATLPQYEWIELYNPTDATFSLEGVQLMYNDRTFPLENISLPAKQYLILTSQNGAAELSNFGNVIGLTVWPTLNNSGARVGLWHDDRGIIDEVSYSSSWYSTVQRRNGGWSLERINPNIRCAIPSNWQGSAALQGATPGSRNSIFDDTSSPIVAVVKAVVSADNILLYFDMDVENILTISEILLSDDQTSVVDFSLDGDSLTLHLSRAIQKDAPLRMTIFGQLCGADIEIEHELFVASEMQYNDVVINEVLFNPKEGGVDFVEIYNKSDRIIDLKNWRVGNRVLTQQAHLLHPKTYLVITTDPEIIRFHYPSAQLQQVIVLPSLPNYANQQGVVTLSASEGLVDSLYYQASMHNPLLTNVRGISLERKRPDEDTNLYGNFTSSSSLHEGATPGYENSKAETQTKENLKIYLLKKTFSPDHDSVDDELQILYELTHGNWMMNVTIFDDRGRMVNRLIRQKNAGLNGAIVWDGIAENGQQAPSGIYIYVAELYDQNGASHVKKESFVLVRKGGGY